MYMISLPLPGVPWDELKVGGEYKFLYYGESKTLDHTFETKVRIIDMWDGGRKGPLGKGPVVAYEHLEDSGDVDRGFTGFRTKDEYEFNFIFRYIA